MERREKGVRVRCVMGRRGEMRIVFLIHTNLGSCKSFFCSANDIIQFGWLACSQQMVFKK